jgi:hypothetical protein
LKILAEKHKSASKHNEPAKKVIIETYIECNFCGEKLTEPVRLKKINMEYSFLRFLQHLTLSGGKTDQTRKNVESFPCEHNETSRVFTYDEALVK